MIENNNIYSCKYKIFLLHHAKPNIFKRINSIEQALFVELVN